MVPAKKKTKIPKLPDRSNLVIGLTGPFGSGCGKMRGVLSGLDFNFHDFRISDHIRDELKETRGFIEKGKPNWRKVLQEHGNKQRKKDPAYWIKKVVNKIDTKGVGNENIVIDCFRNFQEVQEIRKIYPRFFLVAICAEKDERWKRVQSDYKGDYAEFENDDRRDKNEDFKWGQSVQKCVDDADYVYYNSTHSVVVQDGKEEPNTEAIKRILKKQADDFVPLMQGVESHRNPRSEEVHITEAYAQSNSSTCLKRHVGAIITVSRNGRNDDVQEFTISTGFNENPPSIPTCFSEDETCFKDEDMASKLLAQGKNIYCPSCGKHHENLTDPWLCCGCGMSFSGQLHPNRNMELCTAIHAEERAILSLNGRSAKGGTLYVTTFPCFRCARLILDAEIKKVVYVEAYPTPETKHFLTSNKVIVKPFDGFTARSFFRVFPKVN